jgi:hypothetical protein
MPPQNSENPHPETPPQSTGNSGTNLPEQPAAHSVGQVFNPGPAQNLNTPTQNTPNSFDPQAILPEQLVSSSSMDQELNKKSRFKPSKKIAILALAPVLLIAGSAGAYFGYYIPNKPENVWKTALTNTGKGYDKVTQYATSKKATKEMATSGSFKISGSLAADGSFKGLYDGKNGQLTGTVSAAGLKVDYDVRALQSAVDSSDIYFKVDGIQGLGDLVGGYAGLLGADDTTVTKALNGLNGQWYFIDHTLFDQFSQGSNDGLKITSDDISGALKAVGDSSKQYLFTNDPQKQAVVVKQYVGKESQDGRKVYHYKAGVNKENLTAYNKSLCDNLIKTKLFKLFSSGSSSADEDFSKECNDSTGIDKIKDSQTADVWVDLHTKLIHKIRFTDSKNKNNYFDLVQDYQGGDEFPFSIATHTQDSVDSGIKASTKSTTTTTSGLIKMNLNMKTNAFSADANFNEAGESKENATFNIKIVPSNEKVNAQKPAGAKTIIQLINDLGFGDISAAGSQTSAADTERRTDINAIATQMEVYYTDNGTYPVYKGQVNSDAWISTNLKGADLNAFRAPNQKANSMVNSATPTKDQFGYVPLMADGKTACTTNSCAKYNLYWYSEAEGKVLSKESLN